MDILIADNQQAVITAAEECNPSFDIELGNPLAFDIDAVVSPDMKKVKVDGKFKPDDSLPQEVHQASKFFGQPDANGYIAIKLQ